MTAAALDAMPEAEAGYQGVEMLWAERPAWSEIPADVRAGIQRLAGGAVTAGRTPPGGHSPQLAAILDLDDGRRVFAKAARIESGGFAEVVKREAEVTGALPVGAPAPSLLACGEAAGWLAAVYTAVDGRHPQLVPDSGDLVPMLDALAAVARLPVDDRLRSLVRGAAGVELAAYLHGWQTLAADRPADLDPWALRHLPVLAALESDRFRVLPGSALGHSDCRPDNMLIGPDGDVVLVDWAFALHSAAPWLDAALLAPQLVVAGWDPAAAVQALAEHPVMDRADHGESVVFWTALVGYWQRSCRLEAPAGVPGIRPYQRAAAEAGVRILQLFVDG